MNAPVCNRGQVEIGPECAPAVSVVSARGCETWVSVVCLSPRPRLTCAPSARRQTLHRPHQVTSVTLWGCVCVCLMWLRLWTVCIHVGEPVCVWVSEGVDAVEPEQDWSILRILRT